MKRVLSGIQPSGSLHIGNYFGMMNRMIKYQDENELFSCIVNYHALTTINDPEVLRNNTINATLDFFALGLDPEKSTFWIQGDVPIITEFTWIISNVTNMASMFRWANVFNGDLSSWDVSSVTDMNYMFEMS